MGGSWRGTTQWLRMSGGFGQDSQRTFATMSARTSKLGTLWAETAAMLGARANSLTFLRSRALGSSASADRVVESAGTISQETDSQRPSSVTREISRRGLSKARVVSSDQPRIATAEL